MLGELNTAMYRPSRRSTLPKSSKVRRCLFGRVNHEELNKDLQREMQTNCLQQKVRWNFDFENECPLPGGRYNWTAVERSEYVPAVYQTSYSARERVRRAAAVSRTAGLKRRHPDTERSAERVQHKGGDEENMPLTPEDSTTASAVVNSTSNSPTLGVRRALRFSPVTAQSHITTYFPQRKRQRKAEKAELH